MGAVNVKRYLINGFLMVVVSVMAITFYHVLFAKKIAFVKLNDIYSGFNLTKTYEERAEKTVNTRTHLLDSMKLEIERTVRKFNAQGKVSEDELSTLNYLKKEYFEKKKSFEESNAGMIKQYEEQIWAQINKYVVEFGEANGYQIILGANGSGNVMYSDKAIDVTEAAIKYINSKQSGK
ncbi:MAG: OmpH family outer membrane protein [Sediminibacterium sp.]|nr:OmpH family outer membrane protein [Sediminibacterium sp.]